MSEVVLSIARQIYWIPRENHLSINVFQKRLSRKSVLKSRYFYGHLNLISLYMVDKYTVYTVRPVNNGLGDWEVYADIKAPSGLFVPRTEQGTVIIVPTKKQAKEEAKRRAGPDDKVKIKST